MNTKVVFYGGLVVFTLAIIFGLAIAACAPSSSETLPEPTTRALHPDFEFVTIKPGHYRMVDTRYNYVCYVFAYEDQVWCGPLLTE